MMYGMIQNDMFIVYLTENNTFSSNYYNILDQFSIET